METYVTSDGKRMVSTMMSASSELLATQLALLRKLDLGTVIRGKFPGNDLGRQLDEEAKKLARKSRGELFLQIILHLNQTLGIDPRHYDSLADFENNAEAIINGACKAVREIDRHFCGTDFDSVREFLGRELFKGMRPGYAGGHEPVSEDAIKSYVEKIRNLTATLLTLLGHWGVVVDVLALPFFFVVQSMELQRRVALLVILNFALLENRSDEVLRTTCAEALRLWSDAKQMRNGAKASLAANKQAYLRAQQARADAENEMKRLQSVEKELKQKVTSAEGNYWGLNQLS